MASKAADKWIVTALCNQTRHLPGGTFGNHSPYATVCFVDGSGKRHGEKRKTKVHKDGGASACEWNVSYFVHSHPTRYALLTLAQHTRGCCCST